MFNNIFGSLSLALTFVQPFDNVIMILSGIFVNIRYKRARMTGLAGELRNDYVRQIIRLVFFTCRKH